MFTIGFTPEASDDLQELRKFDQTLILDALDVQLVHQPGDETRKRKKLRPNQLAEWELRIDNFRVFYDIMTDANQVKIVAIGEKRGNKLYIRGQEYEL